MSLQKRSEPLPELARIEQAAGAIRERLGEPPEIMIVLGSGLGSIAEYLEQPVVLPYHEIPGFPATTVQGHNGEWLFGRLGGR